MTTVRRKDSIEQLRTQLLDEVRAELRAESVRARADLENAIAELRTRMEIDRSLSGHLFAQLRRALCALDSDELLRHRQWAERQVELFDVYLDEAAALAVPAQATDDVASLHDRIDAAVGEAVTVRIEFDRFTEQAQHRFDEVTVRLAEAEARLAEHGVDVADASQTERLDEIERALERLSGATADPFIVAEPLVDPGADADRSAVAMAAGVSDRVDEDPLSRLALTIADAERGGSISSPNGDHRPSPAAVAPTSAIGALGGSVSSPPQPDVPAPTNAQPVGPPRVPNPDRSGEGGG